LLEIRSLDVSVKKNEKTFKIINNISFEIDEGEILGLAGESGCGKTITALSIPNLLPHNVKITNGNILYKNKSLNSLTEKELSNIRGKDISIIFQDVKQSLNPLMKIGNQIMETLELGGCKNITENKNICLDMLSILGFDDPKIIFNAYPHQLSGGMCQRVMTAIAVIRRPEFLIADEPSSSLDEESQKKCLCLLMQMNREKKMSLLVISHDLSIIRQFCSRFLIMYAGRIIEEGPTSAFFSPLHPYTKALINTIPEKNKKNTKLENIPGLVPSIDEPLKGCPFAPRCKKAKSICFDLFPEAVYTKDRQKVYCYFPETERQ